jgi:outer membrane protein OmpA-like peptidoglycan-associated protein
MDIAPEYLKVMRVIYPEAENAPFLVRGLILDEFGNYIPDYSAQDKPLEWSAIHYCKMGVLGKPHNDFSKQEFEPMRPPLEISVLLDNSAAADNNYLAFDYIKDYIFRLSPTDKVSCAYYNHLYHELLPSHFAKKAALILSEKDIPRPSGLSGLFRAAYHSLKDMENGGDNSTDALMIITFSPDNSSLIYDANDVAMLARSKGIPIYIIAVGSAIHSYPLRYMAGYSGGRYYNIPDEKVQDIYDIMREIVFSRRAYYEFELPADDPDFSRCRKSKSELTIETRKSSASDEFYIYKDPLPQYMPYQAVAAFGYRDTTVSQEFYPLIESLAKVLMDNLDFGIELIGHSSIEGNEQLNRMFSVKRAEAVKRLIVSHGVPADQIRVRGEGANQPIYYLQQIPWQQYYNRRVEIRWLDPAMKPFEIIADRNWTETDALEDVEKWEKKGYNAYFERYLRNNIPVYRVKLWGYATIEEARNEVESLSSKYDIKFEVE